MNDVPGYASEIEEGNIAWWSGDHSPVKGYWFAPANSGANHCSDGNRELGFTGVLKALKQEVPGEGKPTEHQVQMIIICPYAFTHKAPETFQAAEAKLEEGVGIHQAVPRSATFLHEAFHVLHGSNFLQGEDEICKCPVHCPDTLVPSCVSCFQTTSRQLSISSADADNSIITSS